MFISRYVLNYLLYVYLLGSYCDVGVGRRVGGRVEGSVRSGVGVGGVVMGWSCRVHYSALRDSTWTLQRRPWRCVGVGVSYMWA